MESQSNFPTAVHLNLAINQLQDEKAILHKMPAFLDFHIYGTVCCCPNLKSKGADAHQGVIYCCCKHSFAM